MIEDENTANQAILNVGNNRSSTLATCLATAPNFLLNDQEAKGIIDEQISIIQENWEEICNEAELTEIDRNLFQQRFFLNDYIFE